MKTINPKVAPLVNAAQIAGADEGSQEFWREVAAHTGLRERQRAELVTPRRLTEAPKIHTV